MIERDPRISLINQPNAGVSSARNHAIAEADSELIAQLDADDAYEPSYLAQVLSAFADRPDLSLCCTDAFTFQEMGRPTGRRSQQGSMVPPVTPQRVILRQFQIHTATTFRRSVFEQVGGYDPKLQVAEDLDLWIRMLIAGATVRYIDMPLVWYRQNGDRSLSADAVHLMRQEILVHQKILSMDCSYHMQARMRIEQLEHSIAVEGAKGALLKGQYEEFFGHSRRAFQTGRNRKLGAATALARLSPHAARFVVSRMK